MKNIFTLLLLSVFTAAAFAAGPQTKLTVSSAYAGQLRIMVDGNSYQIDNNRSSADFVLNNLSAGNHNIKIYKQATRNNGRKNVYNDNNVQVLYNAYIFLRPLYHTDLTINRFGKVFSDEMQMTGRYYDDGNENNYPGNYPAYNQQMTQQNFDALKSVIRRESFDNSRLNIAKQAGSANYFSAAQVRELLQSFSFDASRLDLAKFLYSRTTDKGNYFTVNDAFAYSSSRDELANYVRQQP
jgi:hypothetical protein